MKVDLDTEWIVRVNPLQPIVVCYSLVLVETMRTGTGSGHNMALKSSNRIDYPITVNLSTLHFLEEVKYSELYVQNFFNISKIRMIQSLKSRFAKSNNSRF